MPKFLWIVIAIKNQNVKCMRGIVFERFGEMVSELENDYRILRIVNSDKDSVDYPMWMDIEECEIVLHKKFQYEKTNILE